MRNDFGKFLVGSCCLGLALVSSGCGQGVTGEVKVQSESLSIPQSAVSAAEAETQATEFKICVRRIRLERDDDESATSKESGTDEADEDGYVEFSPGLIDLTDGKSKDWGEIRVPVGFKLKRIKIKVQKHEQLCGVDYSLKYGAATTNRDLEFRWRFNPEVELKDGSTVKLELEKAIAAIRAAAQANDFNKVKDYLDRCEDDAAKAL